MFAIFVILLAGTATAHEFDTNDRRGRNHSTVFEIRLDTAKSAAPNANDLFQKDIHLAYTDRGNRYFENLQYEHAIADYATAIRFKPDFATAYYNRGLAHDHLRQYDRAAVDFEIVVRLELGNARAHNSLAWLLATAPSPSVRDGARAIAIASRAVLLRDIAEYRDTLAAAYAEAGRFAEAVREQERAIEMARQEGIGDLAGWQTRLRLFKQSHPFRK